MLLLDSAGVQRALARTLGPIADHARRISSGGARLPMCYGTSFGPHLVEMLTPPGLSHRPRATSLTSHELLNAGPSSCGSSGGPHISVYRSLHMEIRIQSSSSRFIQFRNTKRSLPVFGENDQVGGYVILSPNCASSGRLLITLEGAFLYSSSNMHSQSSSIDGCGKRKHVFFSTSTSIVISNNSRSIFREAFSTHARRQLSASSIQIPSTKRTYQFKFDLPRGSRPGEDLPPTFSSLTLADGVAPATATPSTEVLYMVSAVWESTDGQRDRASLEAPILYHPDTDFQSLDGLSVNSEYWLEMPLKSDRRIPFQCAVTLPSPMVFPRPKHIPYFVVFKTSPRSSSLAREIASDASICVTLLRHVTVSEHLSLPPTPPDTPSSSSDDLRVTSSPRKNFLRFVAKNATPAVTRSCPEEIFRVVDLLPTPILPVSTAFSESCTLNTDMVIGFPKRPRHHCSPKEHPSLQSLRSLPDGLYKGKFQINKDMIPSIDWAGISVKYYLDVSVNFGQDELRARIPIRVC